MDKIVRKEFIGSWVMFTFLCLTIILIPVAILYFYTHLIEIETEIENAEEYIAGYRSRVTDEF